MDGLMAYCGLVCDRCPIYLITREDDPVKQRKTRAKIARFIGKKYSIKLRPDEITDCDGCTTADGRLFAMCRECTIRACAQGKSIATCAACPDYACERLSPIFADEPKAKARLDALWKSC